MRDRRKEARERLRRRKAAARLRERERREAESQAAGASKAASAPKAPTKLPAIGAGNSEPRTADRGARVPKQGSSPESEKIERERQRAIETLERDVASLSRLSPSSQTTAELDRLRREIDELKHDFYSHLGAWQKLQLARHPQRPYPEDFVRLVFDNFSEIHGDRSFADDPALFAGMTWFEGRPVMVVGTHKGRDTKQRVARNFGQVKPEGYRKALRVMRLAAKFERPIFVFVDTPGAYPGVDAEERGQAEAIARNIREMTRLAVPIIVTITGEGGSGGALAIAAGDRVFMLENSVYSVISPEGCASIMWRDAAKAEIAATALKITAADLLELRLVDEIVPEPEGGAHENHAAAASLLKPVLARALAEVAGLSPQQILESRYEKFRRMGQFFA